MTGSGVVAAGVWTAVGAGGTLHGRRGPQASRSPPGRRGPPRPAPASPPAGPRRRRRRRGRGRGGSRGPARVRLRRRRRGAGGGGGGGAGAGAGASSSLLSTSASSGSSGPSVGSPDCRLGRRRVDLVALRERDPAVGGAEQRGRGHQDRGRPPATQLGGRSHPSRRSRHCGQSGWCASSSCSGPASRWRRSEFISAVLAILLDRAVAVDVHSWPTCSGRSPAAGPGSDWWKLPPALT